mmetsp:Transcript_15245/g.21379  ORF Transcript_15245/g.21379 Transcript_15245/m.21379 type:complete len:144 (+) Transcript_15245:188-619(+)
MLPFLLLTLFYASVSVSAHPLPIYESSFKAYHCTLVTYNATNVVRKATPGPFCSITFVSGSERETLISYSIYSAGCVIEIDFEVEGEVVTFTHYFDQYVTKDNSVRMFLNDLSVGQQRTYHIGDRGGVLTPYILALEGDDQNK